MEDEPVGLEDCWAILPESEVIAYMDTAVENWKKQDIRGHGFVVPAPLYDRVIMLLKDTAGGLAIGVLSTSRVNAFLGAVYWKGVQIVPEDEK